MLNYTVWNRTVNMYKIVLVLNNLKWLIRHKTKQNKLTNQKDVQPIQQESMIIYKFQCQCDADYIGRTTQRLEVHVSQHVPGCMRKRFKILTPGCLKSHDSVIYKHLCDHNLCRFYYSTRGFLLCTRHLFVCFVFSFFFFFCQFLPASLLLGWYSIIEDFFASSFLSGFSSSLCLDTLFPHEGNRDSFLPIPFIS